MILHIAVENNTKFFLYYYNTIYIDGFGFFFFFIFFQIA